MVEMSVNADSCICRKITLYSKVSFPYDLIGLAIELKN